VSKFMTPSRRMAALISLLLLALFGAVLLTPMFFKDVQFEPALVQTLLTLVVLAVNFYLGSSNSSQAKDDKPAPAPTPERTQA
jgi:glucose dehydrogenase